MVNTKTVLQFYQWQMPVNIIQTSNWIQVFKKNSNVCVGENLDNI